jgi:Cu(I)/Ag(I) efflux system membrane fusion protein
VPDWVAAQEEFLAVRRMRVDERLVDGARQRMRLAGMTDEQIAAVEASGTLHPRLTVVAPIGGVVAELSARDGMTDMAGAPLFRLNGLGTVWVNAEVPESMAAAVRPGARVEATTPALPEKTFKGKVSALLPEVNPATRTLKARVELSNPGAQLVPGMFARVSFAPGARREMLLVPSDAVIRTGRRNLVMEALADGRFAPVEVEVGAESGGQTEIRKGLAAGRKVVVSGQFLIDSEASLKGLDLRLKDAPGSQPPAAGATDASDSRAGPASGTPPAKTAGQVHRASGKVEAISEREVILEHGPVASLKWPGMTMGFRLPAGQPKNIAKGSTVQFEFRQASDGEFEIVTIKPAAPGARAAAPDSDKAPAPATPPKAGTPPPAAAHDHGGHK